MLPGRVEPGVVKQVFADLIPQGIRVAGDQHQSGPGRHQTCRARETLSPGLRVVDLGQSVVVQRGDKAEAQPGRPPGRRFDRTTDGQQRGGWRRGRGCHSYGPTLDLERFSLPGPQDDPYRLLGRPAALRPVAAEHLELLDPVADSDHHLQSTGGQAVKGRDVLGGPQGVLQGQQQGRHRAEEVPRRTEHSSSEDQRGTHVPVLGAVVLGKDHRGEPALVGPPNHL